MNNKSFTLIEIIVVAVIIGFLSLMAIPPLLLTVQRSYAQDAYHNLMIIYAAQQYFYQNNNLQYYVSPSCPGSGDPGINSSTTGLSLNIISQAGTQYCCTLDDLTAGHNKACFAQNSSFTMEVVLTNPIVGSTPIYSIDSTTNPFCNNPGTKTPGANCP